MIGSPILSGADVNAARGFCNSSETMFLVGSNLGFPAAGQL